MYAISITYLDMSCKDGQYPHQMQSHQQNFALPQQEMDSRHAYFQNSPIVHHLACKVVSMENLESVEMSNLKFKSRTDFNLLFALT